MTTPAEAYEIYMGVTRHFAGDYDYFRYGGKLRLSRKAFDARPDRWMFERLARKQSPRWNVIASCVAGRKWVGEMIDDEADELALRRMGNVQSLGYLVASELGAVAGMCSGFNGMIVAEPGRVPLLLNETLGGRVSPETAAAVVGVTGCHVYWESLGDPVVADAARLLSRYFPFMEADPKRISRSILEAFTVDAGPAAAYK